MKAMVDSLGDLGEVIHDRTLGLNVIRGLNEKFAHMWHPLPARSPVPDL
jgi:hypothetical protein